MPQAVKAVIFDWGDTLMRDYPEKPGPMYLWDEVSLLDGAEVLLKYLKGKYLLAVATNAECSNTEAMVKALQRVGIAHYFDCFHPRSIWVRPNPTRVSFRRSANNWAYHPAIV